MAYEGKFVDLHVHTNYSDSSFTPEEVIAEARASRLDVVAITDHDTLLGIGPARRAGEPGEGAAVEVVAGVELTSYRDDVEHHVVGLLVDESSTELLERLEAFRLARHRRIFAIARKLEELGVRIDPEAVFELAGEGTVGRAHVAEVLIRDGHARDIPTVYGAYIGTGAPANVPKPCFSAAESVDLIHKAGGVAVLAHPGEEVDTEKIEYFASVGIDGIEAYCPSYGGSLRRRYLQLADYYGLVPAGGSDDHGRLKERILLGTVQLPGEILDRLVERAQRWR